MSGQVRAFGSRISTVDRRGIACSGMGHGAWLIRLHADRASVQLGFAAASGPSEPGAGDDRPVEMSPGHATGVGGVPVAVDRTLGRRDPVTLTV